MLRKSINTLHNIKASIHGERRSANVSKQMLNTFSKLDEIKKNKDLDNYGKKVLAKKYLAHARGEVYANMGDTLASIQSEYKSTEKELFSSNRALGDADIVMLPVVYEKFNKGEADVNNKNIAQMLLQLNAQGLAPDSVVSLVDKAQSPTVVAKINNLMEDTAMLGHMKDEFEREVNSIFPEIDKFEEIV